MTRHDCFSRSLIVVGCITAMACSQRQAGPQPLSAADASALGDSIRATVHGFAKMWGPQLCNDLTPLIRQFDVDGGVMAVGDTVVMIEGEPELRAANAGAFCGVPYQATVLDTVFVQVLTRDAAVTASTWHQALPTQLGGREH